MKYISSSFFGRFIGKPTVIKITVKGVCIESEGRLIDLQWDELINPPIFQLSFFGQMLSFNTAKQSFVFTMLTYGSKRIHRDNCQMLWATANIKRVETLINAINEMTTSQYVRQSNIDQIKLAANQEVKAWYPWIKSSKAKNIVYEKLQLLIEFQKWGATDVESCRERYISQQLNEHKIFFDNVESEKLTLSQRRACIIDNDNNLLLAGAGTGKTSVMVGRTGYLINSNQAKYDDILLLAYGRKAANEMDKRIKSKLNTDKVKAATFHSLGLNIIAQVEDGKPSLSVFAEDEKAKSKWIQAYFEKLINESSQYRVLILEYFKKYYYFEKEDSDFETRGDKHQYFGDNDIRTLKDEMVKSFGELHIANWLFSMGIAYEYETKYEHDVKTIERRQYQPDFFLPELNMYIEYYGIDENGDTASYINKAEYRESMQWKRETHKRFGTYCIDLTYDQHKKGVLLHSLEQAVIERKNQFETLDEGLRPQFESLTADQMFSELLKTGRISVLAKIFTKLVGLYKAAALNQKLERKIILNSSYPKQTEKALELLKPILIAYEKHLNAHSDIDFEDMINKAIDYVQSGRFKSPWSYIMVDEFQDISEPRARLVKALRDNNKKSSVFAVGDDWQAIYRFSGADITLTTQFENYFGVTTQSELDQTFRFNNQIGNVATGFISKNPEQISKKIESFKKVKAPAVSLLKRESQGFKKGSVTELDNGAVDDVLSAISSKVCKPVTVYLLARFWYQLPNATEINRLNNRYPLLKVEPQSFHASKGKEADYVIIIGLNKGLHGFPSEKVTPSLVDALLPKKEVYKHAEERRLLYVAITRAKDRAYLIADMSDVSYFVKELESEHQIECHEFETTLSQLIVNDINCMVCETGILKKRTGKYGNFYSCSYFPRCDHKEKPCTKCQSPMTRTKYPGFKVCLNDSCKNMIPTCELCNAEMVLRSSQRGEFWGCRNYRGNDPMSCKNGVDSAKVDWPDLVT